ncbi:hypothetical protein B0I37DRAFT_363064 [Chaetomium sp. MPI-CAGE-AT-0009]|nr:hypothetical protein B0I37DRAFT_363064 [Chaetomium sp. MPI-CAGE-AT-0009]
MLPCSGHLMQLFVALLTFGLLTTATRTYRYHRFHEPLEGSRRRRVKWFLPPFPDSLHSDYEVLFYLLPAALPSPKPYIGACRTIPALIFAEAPHATLKVPEIPPNITAALLKPNRHCEGSGTPSAKRPDSLARDISGKPWRKCHEFVKQYCEHTGLGQPIRSPSTSHLLSSPSPNGPSPFLAPTGLTSLVARGNRRVLGHSSRHWNHCTLKRKQTCSRLLAGLMSLI